MIVGALVGGIVGVIVVLVKNYRNKSMAKDNLDDDITIDSK